MDAVLRPAPRGTRPPEGRLPSSGAPLLSPRRRRRAGSAPGSPPPALLLLVVLLRRATPGAVATPETRIDGRALSESSLREAESRAFTCLAAAPNLTWYLNGERQETDGSGRLLAAAGDGDSAALEAGDRGSGTFVVTARRLDRRLDCAATDPATGRVSTASVLLNVEFQPEIVRVDAHYREAKEPGLLLVLLVLVQANPPANVTWVDQDGPVTINASSFLLLDTQAYPWLANHTVRVQLHGPPQNASLRVSNSLGIASSSVPPPGLLATQLELPLLALVGAAAVALVVLLSFGVLISWTVSQKAKRSTALPCSQRKPICHGQTGPSLPTCNSMILRQNQEAGQMVLLQSKERKPFWSQETRPLLSKALVDFLQSDTFTEPLA
ncbi:transmembrane protein 25 isoform X2 [Candoia aspera]|uniref:transmembrane protein 25 isoform X2 n=1 Tax=Candoia aspera TaxID=51853 RepID=UPI002FD85974